MIPRLILLALLFAPIMIGCGYTQDVVRPPAPITSFKDPDFAGTAFRQVAVFVDTADLEWRHTLESQMVVAMRNRGMNAIESFRITPPTRSWTEADVRAALARNGVDAYLRFTVASLTVNQKVTPVTSTTTVTHEKKERADRKDVKDSVQQETTMTTMRQAGGDTVTTYHMGYRVTLVETAGSRVAWLATNSIDCDPADRVGSFCDEIAWQMSRDSLLVRTGA
ncbi:MAG: hypothetical protein JST22_02165 [Bacteroidetes bacterium]|nr:hypothetical protein [Bacteroidota bacterium]